MGHGAKGGILMPQTVIKAYSKIISVADVLLSSTHKHNYATTNDTTISISKPITSSGKK